jgi:hypothetical protein
LIGSQQRLAQKNFAVAHLSTAAQSEYFHSVTILGAECIEFNSIVTVNRNLFNASLL